MSDILFLFTLAMQLSFLQYFLLFLLTVLTTFHPRPCFVGAELDPEVEIDPDAYAKINQPIPGIDDVDGEGFTPLMRAASSGQFEAARNYVGGGATIDIVNAVGNTPLMLAIKGGFYHTALELIKLGANLTHRNNYGMSPLLMSIGSGHYEIAGAMLDNGTDANIALLNDGMSALMIAAQRGSTKMVERLIEEGAHVNATCTGGENALMFASTFGHVAAVKILIDNKSNLNHVNNQGYSALVLAASRNQFEVLKLLISSGAQMNYRDSLGRTALDHSIQSSNQEAIDLLVSMGAETPKSGYRVGPDVMKKRREIKAKWKEAEKEKKKGTSEKNNKIY